ncbi:uncharacterized protein PGTG_08941 [Puccinia graminis f. sp. tritici CRL 75-36-700-3]|uniref:Uncharacterized protein n=1 Tax=Puccinia graminis f. sp. tritici (strain CRL 75-36-700-3 / race SCCL) TaxID=418459 RepID=E3KEP1_PUCGT|nr:uncharacterized protein PGTG_08941 [Puccinia graminis f. sp. tritici CRL 75-36-700-3]EFP82745.2 hypothetical protein PGTG_08941 [Puccinia graminis f. sp. tritici CRL 75-36-700-3]
MGVSRGAPENPGSAKSSGSRGAPVIQLRRGPRAPARETGAHFAANCKFTPVPDGVPGPGPRGEGLMPS